MPALLRVLLLALALPVTALAQPAPAPAERDPETIAFAYSSYEDATIAGALAAAGLSPDPAPEGKLVEEIRTVRLEVVEERDPAPRAVNALHAVSRDEVIGREVLLRPGEPWRQALADETRRNLAALPQLSLVLVVAAEGSAPGRTRVLVVTKDVWSLRLNWDLSLSAEGLESLSAAPSETNFLGTHQTVGLLVGWLPLSWSLGAQYAVPRVAGSRVAASASAGLVFATSGSRREGSFGGAQVVSPLWSSRTAWSWGAGASWLEETSRLYSGRRLSTFSLGAEGCAAPSPRCVPWAYRTEIAAASAFVTRSFGWRVKLDLSAGLDARTSRFTLPDLPGFDPATVEAFRSTRLPRSDDRVGPFVQARTYRGEFLRVLDLDTLALQEDYRLGPQAFVRAFALPRALGSSRDVLGLSAGASFTRALGDGFLRAGADATEELDGGTGAVEDGVVRAGAAVATPRGRLGRLVVDATLLDRHANAANRFSTLGGDGRLRGFPSDALVGARLVAANVELRSRPWRLLDSLQLGAVAFYDAGDAFDRWGDLALRHSAGVGARALFPQLDRTVVRADVALPLGGRTAGAAPVGFHASFGQAFSP